MKQTVKYGVHKKDGASAYYTELQKVLLKRVSLSINKEKYPAVIEKLNSVDSQNSYIIHLIMQDIEREQGKAI